jgi:hypothetical protein
LQRLVPEQLVVASVRDRVVGYRCRRDPSFLQAVGTEWFAGELVCSDRLPSRCLVPAAPGLLIALFIKLSALLRPVARTGRAVDRGLAGHQRFVEIV